jgi:hypothetical protein
MCTYAPQSLKSAPLESKQAHSQCLNTYKVQKALNEHLHHSCNSMCLPKSPNEPLCTSKARNKHLYTSNAPNEPLCTSNAPNQPLCNSNAPNQPLCTSHTQCLTRPPPNYLATKELSLATHMSGPITY